LWPGRRWCCRRGDRFLARFLIGEFAAIDIDVAGEVEGEPDLVAMDIDDSDDTQGLPGVSDDNFLADSSGKG